MSPTAPHTTVAAPARPGHLSLSRLTKVFGPVHAVDEVSLEIGAGEFVTLLGESGSGKTTTLLMIAGFEEPTSGDILLDGSSIAQTPAHKRNFGMMFQSYALFPHLNVFDNVAFPLRRRRMSKRDIRKRVSETLELVHLSGYEQRFPHQLSGGQQQRVALARATVYGPPVLLMDEPLSALDKRLRQNMQDELRHLHRNLGTTVVYVTHDQEEALALSDTIALMRNGRIEQVGPPATVYSHPQTLFAASFLGEANLLDGRVCDRQAGGIVALRLASGRQVEATATSRVDEGQPCVLVVRPENVLLADEDNHSVRVTIDEAVYLGSSVRCVGAFETGERCVLTLDVAAGRELVRRGGGYVTWRPEDAVLVAADTEISGAHLQRTGRAAAESPQLQAPDFAA